MCQRIRELNRGMILTVQIPAGECVGDTANYLGGVKCFTCHIRRLCRLARFVVFTTQISIFLRAGIHHLIGSRANILTLDSNLAVQMNIGCSVISLGKFEGKQCNAFNIIGADCDTKFTFNLSLVVVNNRVPNSRVRVLINLIAVARPTDNTLVNIVRAVFRIAPAFNVYYRIAQRRCDLPHRTGGRCPVIRSVGFGTLRRVDQAENCCFFPVRLIRSLVLHNFNALGCPSRGAIGIGDRKRNGCSALAFAGHNAVLIYAKDLLVVAGPLTSVVFSTSLLNDHGCKPSRLELSYLIITINRNFRHLGEIGHCDFNGFCNNRSIGSFVRTCSSHCVLRRYCEGDRSSADSHTCNLGCIARNWCNRRLARITGFPSAGIALRIFRQNFGRKVNRFALRHACFCNFLVINHELSICRRNRVGHIDLQFSRDCAVIVVRNSKLHGCTAHALGGDCAIFCHRQNITVIYAPSAAFEFCIGRGDHSFQLALLILGKLQLSDCRILTLDLDCGIGDSIHDMDLEGFCVTNNRPITMGNGRLACRFAFNVQCGRILISNNFHIFISAFHSPLVTSPSVAFQCCFLIRIDRYLAVRGRLRVVQVRGVHGIVLFLRFGCLACGCHRVSCLTCGFRRVGCLTFGFHRFGCLTFGFHRFGCLTFGFRRVSCLTCGFHRFGCLTFGCRRVSCLTFGFHSVSCLTFGCRRFGCLIFGFRRRGFLAHNARGFAFALVFVALALDVVRDACGVLFINEIIGQNASGEHGKHHGNGKDHCNDSFFHRFFLLFFKIFSTLAGG